MNRSEKVVHFTIHALERIQERRTDEKEVKEAIRKGKWKPAEKGRFISSRIFPFEKEHYGRYYKTKEVVPVFKEDDERILVITVFTFFSQRGQL
jgi:hypothetical protein